MRNNEGVSILSLQDRVVRKKEEQQEDPMNLKASQGRLRFKFQAGRHGVKFALVVVPTQTTGWSSRTMDHKHILYLDYDFKVYDFVKEEIAYLQDKFKLSPFYLFCSSNEVNEGGIRFGNYHAICLTKKLISEIRAIQRHSATDKLYQGMTDRSIYGSWAIRVFPKLSAGKEVKSKPVFCEVVGAEKGLKNPISSGHLLQLMKHYNIPEINYQQPDGYTRIWEVEYETFKGG